MRIWLKEVRKSNNISISVSTERSGITTSYYNMIEAGTRNPSVPLAQRIAELLSFDWTLFFENAEGVGSESNID